MNKPCDESLSKEDEGRGGGARSQRPCFSLDFILRTSRNSLKGFEQGNDMIRFVCEETIGEDWQVWCSCGEIS